MKKLFVLTLAVVLVFGMSAVSMAEDPYDGTVDVYQNGSEHFANIEQTPGSRGTSASLSQYGLNQFADIVQTNDVGWINAVQSNTKNVLVSDQTGYNVTALIRQTRGTNNSYVSINQANRSDARVYQYNQWNSSVIIDQNSLRLGQSNSAYVEQYRGHQNFASIVQDARAFKYGENDGYGEMDGHTANILQGGIGNVALIEQTSRFNEDSSDWGNSYASVDQNGNNNFTNVIQDGSNHYADLNQTGDNNFINLEQINKNNTTTVEQIGSNNVTNIVQE
jgi:hypothetical protein